VIAERVVVDAVANEVTFVVIVEVKVRLMRLRGDVAGAVVVTDPALAVETVRAVGDAGVAEELGGLSKGPFCSEFRAELEEAATST